MTLDYRNGVSIAEIVVYVPCLLIAAFLAIKHGFGRNAGWIYLVIFTMIRIAGGCVQLATISSQSTGIYTASVLLQTIGLSPLELTALGLLSRITDSINHNHKGFIKTIHLRMVQVLVLVALILNIVGGVQASDKLSSSGLFVLPTISKVGVALFVLAFVLIAAVCLVTSFHISHALLGDKRLLLAVALSLPFILTRLIYSCFATFTHERKFNQLEGSVTIFLCMGLIMEFFVVAIYEGIGVTLKQSGRGPSDSEQVSNRYQEAENGPTGALTDGRTGLQKTGHFAKNVWRYTIIGTIISGVASRSKKESSVEDGHMALTATDRH